MKGTNGIRKTMKKDEIIYRRKRLLNKRKRRENEVY
jgi:hypothetical protein